MSTDLLKKLSIAVAVVVAMWVLSETLRGSRAAETIDFELAEVTLEGIDSIVLTRPADTIRLRRGSGSAWTVNGHVAAYGGLSDFVTALGEELPVQLAGRNAATHGRFDLTDQTARRLRVFRNSEIVLDLLLGKRGRDFQSLYFREPGMDDVFLANTRLGAFADRRLDDWRDKVIAAVQPEGVARIDITRGGVRYSLRRQPDSIWSVDGAGAKGTAVNSLLEQFRALNASGFPSETEADSADFELPDRRIAVYGPGDASLVELAFDSTTTGYLVRRADSPVLFRLDRFKVDQLTPADSVLREETREGN